MFSLALRSPSAALFLALACALVPARAEEPVRGLLPDDVVPHEYRIEVAPDPVRARFSGSVEIDVDVVRPVQRIVLDAADLVIDRATLDDGPRPGLVRLDARRERATFDFGAPVAVGPHTLHISYRGRINQQASGLFALKYSTGSGAPRQALFTQFEQTDARRFVPCWDEPARKAVFVLGATLPAGEMAVSNMPVAASAPAPGAAGRRHVRFQPTPAMSTYLLFFGAGDFERVHREVDGVDVGVIVKRGDGAHAAYALEAAAALLPWYDEYFGVKYPLPKLDMIAGPGGSLFYGAMENWGALFYFEHDLLVDPRVSTEQDRQDVFSTVAHEMAHQWFGDLVTMAWWDHLWLNEGFAEWMQTRAAAALHPEWKPWLQALRDRDTAMDKDALAGTHPIVSPVRTEAEADGLFDDITYRKGAQVLRTLETALGEEAFRAGIRRYIGAHAYGSVVTDDLWRALDEGAPRAIAALAHDYTLQPGVPLVREESAICVDGRTRLTLSQGEFRIGGDGAARRWQVPLAVRVPGGPAVVQVIAGPAPQTLELEGCGPVLLDAGQATYTRASYTGPGLEALRTRLSDLDPDDQAGLMQDTAALALHGDVPMPALGRWLQSLPAGADPGVARVWVDELLLLDQIADGTRLQPILRAHARRLLAPVAARVGWSPAPGESPNDAKLREAVLQALGGFGDAEVIAQARERFRAYLRDPSALDAAARRIVLDVVAQSADAATWDKLHALARRAPTTMERQDLYGTLAAPRDPVLAGRALVVALSGEPPATVVGSMLLAAARHHPRKVFDLVDARWKRVGPLIGVGRAAPLVADLVRQSADGVLVAGLQSFARRRAPDGTLRAFASAEAEIAWRAQVRVQRLPALVDWMSAQDSGPAADAAR